jgi:hypothetical protein
LSDSLAAQPQSLERPHSKFSKQKRNKEKERVRPLAATTIKKIQDRGMQSLFQTILENELLGGRAPTHAPPKQFCFEALPARGGA